MAQIYSAPSLSEVIRQLMMYRLTGVLMIRRATGSRREEASLAIVQGQPVRVRWGMYEDNANESTLKWMNGWGEIHFVFYAKESQRQLPPPHQEQSRPQNLQYPSHLLPPSPITRPLPMIQMNGNSSPMTRTPVRDEGGQTQRTYEDAIPHMNPSQNTVKQFPEEPRSLREMPGIAPEKNIPLLTKQARNYPITNLTRYDRTIFLLINDRRSIADLSQLTRRSLPEVYASLHRLRDLQLIESSY